MKLRNSHRLTLTTLAGLATIACAAPLLGQEAPKNSTVTPIPKTADLDVRGAEVTHRPELGSLVFEMTVAGNAGGTVPEPRGTMAAAPVLAHVFPTTLSPTDAGFGDVEGLLALAVTSHPDFDDTPLWDENGDKDRDNDGVVYHPHWVVLVPDERVAGGLAVREIATGENAVLPPTNPGMPMYMDSPGFNVVLQGNKLRVIVPTWRVSGRTSFRYDAVTAYLQVMPEGDLPLLGVYEVYGVLSGDLSLPFETKAP